MSDTIHPIGRVFDTNSYHAPPKKSANPSVSSGEKSKTQTSSKYIIEDKSLVYERYDRHGKLISRVPWTVHPIDKKA
jgi:hypothetical protein